MSHAQIKTIAAKAPTTMEELADCGLPENVQKNYGERIVKNISTYIEMENLQSFIENRPKKKSKADLVVVAKASTAKAPNVIDVLDDSGDEFQDDGIDFSSIPLACSQPNTRHASNLKSSKKSSYFN